jgi:hypothetical protein
MFKQFHYITITIITGILAILAGFWNFATLQFVFGVIFLLLLSYEYGKKLFFCNNKIVQIILGFFAVICLIMIVGTLFFYFYSLNYLFILTIVIVLPLALNIFSGYFVQNSHARNIPNDYNLKRILLRQLADRNDKILSFSLITVYLVMSAIVFYVLKINSTTAPLRSLWHIIPSYFFIIYFLSTLVLLLIIFSKRQFEKFDIKLLLIICHLFITSCLLFFIFKLGFGFDPFIHQATMKIILETGTITPKPFYYIGQYSLEFFFVKFLGLNINWLDKILIIFLSALLLPTTLYYGLSKKIADKKNLYLIILSLFIFLPLGFTILTTPQSLANLFTIILIILAFGSICHSECQRRILLEYQTLVNTRSFAVAQDDSSLFKNEIILLVISISIFTIHPLSGIPAFIFLFLFYLWNQFKTTDKKMFLNLFITFSILGTISLPLIWLINGQISSQATVSVNPNVFQDFKQYLKNFELINFKYQGQYKPILSLIYFIYFNIKIIFTIIIFGTICKSFKQKKIKTLIPYLTTFLILIINYFLLKFFLVFDFLIAYEKNSYANRVLQISLFFLLPLIFIFFENLWQKILLQKKVLLYVILILFPLVLTVSFYLTYPRHDNYSASGGFSISQSDITAVKYINTDAKNDFIVLANQQTSVVALQEFGFKKYFNTEKEEIFYYPIPTGGPLYQYYLQMVNTQPDREIMNQAMDLVGVKESYFVINKYWWNYGKIVEQSKKIADDFVMIGDGEIFIFKFVR